MKTKSLLSILWIIVMFNMLFADIFSIMVELVNKNTLDIPGDVKMIMGIAAIITNIPIFMILLSRILVYRWNKIVNIVVAVLTLIYVIGGGDTAPHYLIAAGVESLILISIIIISIRWKKDKD